jgi:hypothetical protein
MTITLDATQCRSLLKLMRLLSNIPSDDIDNIRDEVIIKMVERLLKMQLSEV